MAKVKIKLNGQGIRNLLKSPEAENICTEIAGQVVSGTGEPGYEAGPMRYPERSGAVVRATTEEAINDALENMTLIKAVSGKL